MTPPVEGSAVERPQRRWVRPLMWLLSLATIAAVVVALRDRMGAVGQAGDLPGVLPIAVAVIANVVATFVMTDAWRKVVAIGAPEPDWRTSLWVWAASQLSRYTISGAQVAGRAAVAARYGIALLPAGAAALVEVGWQLAVASVFALGLMTSWLPGDGELNWLAWVALVPTAGLVALHLVPQQVTGAVGRGVALLPAKRLRRAGGVIAGLELTRRTVARLTGLYLLNTVIRSAGFLVLFGAVAYARVDLSQFELGLAVGAYVAGQIVGRLAIFAPGGIGPREGVTALILAPSMGGGPALLLVAIVRLVEIVAEVIFVALASWLSRDVRREWVAGG